MADDTPLLSSRQRDALREVANMGAGHAATALSEMTGHRIMISVPRLFVAPLEAVPAQVSAPEEPVAGLLLEIRGDLAGCTLLVFPQPIALRLAELTLRRPKGSSSGLGPLERSALAEAGNILSGHYLNALAEFLRMTLLPSPPSLSVDRSRAVVEAAHRRSGADPAAVVCVESEFRLADGDEALRGFFLMLPSPEALVAILAALRLS